MADRTRSGAVQRATLIGTVLQLAMVISGHWVAAIAALFALMGMAISLLAGWLASSWSGRRGGGAAVDGAIAGGVCALIGIAVSYFLGDVMASVILFGTLASAVTGAIGGWIGGLRAGRS